MTSKEANHQLSTIAKQNFVLGVGAGVVLIPFLAISYSAELDIEFAILILVGTPIVNGLVMIFYSCLGYWLYKISIKKGWIKQEQ